MVRLEKEITEFNMKFEGDERLHRRPADGFDGSRRGQRHSCGIGMTRRVMELQSDTRMLRRPRHPPSASLRGEGGVEEGGARGGILPKRMKSGSSHHVLTFA